MSYDRGAVVWSDDPFKDDLPWAVHSPQSEFVEHYPGRLTDEFVDSVVTELASYVGFDG